MDFRLLLVVIICYQNQKSLSSSLRVILVRLENRTIGVNLGVFRSLFEFAKGCVFSSASLESASIFK